MIFYCHCHIILIYKAKLSVGLGTWLQIQTAISGNMAVCKFKDEYHKILFCFNEPRTFVAHSFHYKIDTLQQKLSGNWIGGMAILSRQKVFLHRLQLKCTCKSPTVHIQLSLQIEYFIAPEPSSIV